MNQSLIDKEVYNNAKTFLFSNTPDKVSEEIIESYLSIPSPKSENISLNDLYLRLLGSAQNANMKAGVVGGSINGIKNLGEILFQFNPEKVLLHYSNDSDQLLEDIIQNLKPKGKIRTSPRSIWPQYNIVKLFCLLLIL